MHNRSILVGCSNFTAALGLIEEIGAYNNLFFCNSCVAQNVFVSLIFFTLSSFIFAGDINFVLFSTTFFVKFLKVLFHKVLNICAVGFENELE